MTKTTANPQVADRGRDPAKRLDRRDDLSHIMAGCMSTKARWIISAVVGLIAPAVLIAESGAAPIADAMACFGNGSFMALAATANAFTMIP